MKSNIAIKKLFKLYGEVESKIFAMSSELTSLLETKIEERDGVFVFANFQSSATDNTISTFGDLTGYECEVNHIHIDDFLEVPDHQNPEILFKSGVSFADQLRMKLISTFPKEHFRIILSYSLDDIPGCVVRFHKVRKNENWIKPDDLEGYKVEGIMILETV